MSLKAMMKLQKVIGCSLTSSATEVADIMESHNVGAVVVLDAEKPVGIITDRDLVLRALMLGDRGLRKPAKEIMTRPVKTVSDTAGIYEVIDLMSECGIRRVCVVNEEGKCTGLVSVGDVMELIIDELSKLKRATAPKSEKLLKKVDGSPGDHYRLSAVNSKSQRDKIAKTDAELDFMLI